MKKVLFLSAFLFLSCTIFAQFSIGPKIGITMSKLSTDYEDFVEEMKTGYQFGAFARFGKKIYVQPELMYQTSGGIIKSETGLNAKTKVNLSSVQIPVMVGYRLLNLNVVNLRIMGGPAIAFVTNKEVTLSSNNLEEAVSGNNIKDAIWSFQLGAGVDVLMFTLDVRYEWGLNNLYDPPSGNEEIDMRSNLWQVSLGWKIL